MGTARAMVMPERWMRSEGAIEGPRCDLRDPTACAVTQATSTIEFEKLRDVWPFCGLTWKFLAQL